MDEHYKGTFDEKTLELVKNKMEENLTVERFQLFIKNLSLQSVEEDKIILYTPKHSNLSLLEKYYKNELTDVVEQLTKYSYELEFAIEGSIEEKEKKEEDKGFKLNPKYNFEEFVEASCNILAVKAAKSIAKNNNIGINPCFIYGGVGLGKTHLIQSIGNYIKNNNLDSTVLYVTSEQFLNEYVKSIKNGTMQVFQHKYRTCDVLLIDDIQFLKNKEGIQEELFNSFNELYEQNKRIVFTSDKRPEELAGLEERLISRFSWGLITDVKPPNFETRLAIVNKKLEKSKINVSDPIRRKIAEKMKKNIRELEGCLNTVVQTCILMNVDATMELTESIIAKRIDESNIKELSVYDIKSAVADYYRVTVEDIDKKKRTKDVSHARQVAMYITRKLTDKSLPAIGQEFGGRDHSTVSSSLKKINELLKYDKKHQKDIQNILEVLENDE